MPNNLIQSGLLTIPEVCKLLRLSRSMVYKMLDAGELASVRFGRSRRIPQAAVEQLLESRLQVSVPSPELNATA